MRLASEPDEFRISSRASGSLENAGERRSQYRGLLKRVRPRVDRDAPPGADEEERMSSLSMQDDHLDAEDLPYELSHELRSSWLDRLRPLWAPESHASSATTSERGSDVSLAPDDLATGLEDAVHAALRRPRGPASISEPLGFFRELDRRVALISVAGRFAAAVGVAAVVALFFVVMVPASHEDSAQTGAAPSGNIQSMKAALNEPPATAEDAKPALCELQNILGAPQSQPAITHEQSETLLQQFMQWREKPAGVKTP